MKKFLTLTIALGLLISSLTACSSETVDNGTNHLNFGCQNYSLSLDPVTNVNASWSGVRYGITECLFKFSDEVVAQENLCDSYEKNEDATVWELHIREGVKFSNGNELTASSVKASIERLYNETNADLGGTGNSNPEGYFVYSSIEADDSTGIVTITCEQSTPNLDGILCYPYFAIIDTSVADEEIVGTGPYKVVASNESISLDTAKNDYYWNGEVPYDTMKFVFIDDSSTKAMALQSGDVDVVENITTASDLENFENDENFFVDTAAGVRTGSTYMNFEGVLENDALRQAILMAIDNETMCDVTVAGMYTAGISVLPSGLDYNYDSLTNPYTYNTEAAIKLLDDAGIIDTDNDGFREIDGVNIDLNYITYASRNLSDFAQAISLQLADIGIKTTVNIRDYDTALSLQNAGEFDLISSNSITVGVGDPQDFLGNWYSQNSPSYGYYQNDEFDEAYESLMVELDSDTRKELITTLQQILIDDACTIVHGYYNSRMFSNASKVTGANIATIDYYWITTEIAPK